MIYSSYELRIKILFEINQTFKIHANFVCLGDPEDIIALSCDVYDQIFVSTNTLGKIK